MTTRHVTLPYRARRQSHVTLSNTALVVVLALLVLLFTAPLGWAV